MNKLFEQILSEESEQSEYKKRQTAATNEVVEFVKKDPNVVNAYGDYGEIHVQLEQKIEDMYKYPHIHEIEDILKKHRLEIGGYLNKAGGDYGNATGFYFTIQSYGQNDDMMKYYLSGGSLD